MDLGNRTPCVIGGNSARGILRTVISRNNAGRSLSVVFVSSNTLNTNACRFILPTEACYYPRAGSSFVGYIMSKFCGSRCHCRFAVGPDTVMRMCRSAPTCNRHIGSIGRISIMLDARTALGARTSTPITCLRLMNDRSGVTCASTTISTRGTGVVAFAFSRVATRNSCGVVIPRGIFMAISNS